MTHGGKQAGWINNSQWRESEKEPETQNEREREREMWNLAEWAESA